MPWDWSSPMTCNLPETKKQVDVLVVGLGPAGASSARGAAERGCSVLAIDRKTRFGEPVQCAEFVPLALRSHGIDANAIVQSIRTMRSTLASGETNSVGSAGLMLHRARFDRALIERARQHGARVLNATVLQQLDVADRRALIRTPNGTTQVRYQFLIAADGARSQVARLAKRSMLQTLRTQQYSVPLNVASEVIDVHLSPQYPGGYGWVFPKNDVANIGVGFVVRSTVALKLALVALLQTLVQQGVVQNNILSRTGGEIPISGMRDDLVQDHILFTGDAAGLTHPITGAGIAPAVISGEQAGACAAEYIHGAGSASLLDYVESLRDIYGPVLSRALSKRREMMRVLHLQQHLSETGLRQCWTGFPDYFH